MHTAALPAPRTSSHIQQPHHSRPYAASPRNCLAQQQLHQFENGEPGWSSPGRDPMELSLHRGRHAGHTLQQRSLLLRRVALLRPPVQQCRDYEPGHVQPGPSQKPVHPRGLRGRARQDDGAGVPRPPRACRHGHGHGRVGDREADATEEPGEEQDRDEAVGVLLRLQREYLPGAHAG